MNTHAYSLKLRYTWGGELLVASTACMATQNKVKMYYNVAEPNPFIRHALEFLLLTKASQSSSVICLPNIPLPFFKAYSIGDCVQNLNKRLFSTHVFSQLRNVTHTKISDLFEGLILRSHPTGSKSKCNRVSQPPRRL